MIGSLFDLNSDSVKAAKLMRWEGSVGPSRLYVATSKLSSLLVGGHQLSVPPFGEGDQLFVPSQVGLCSGVRDCFDRPLTVLCNNWLHVRTA